jgi:muramoyltetrapeptide carboxypeptidase LdcA involved in peptidoglycan recycling
MKIALTNLCKTEDFGKSKYFNDSISFFHENKIEYLDFASGAESLDMMVEKFNQSLESDTDLVWVISGGTTCIQCIDKLDWDKIVRSGKKFYGLSDFTHFSTMAVSKGLTCFYGQGLLRIKKWFPTESDRKFITTFLQTGKPYSENAKPLAFADNDLDISKVKIIGGHLLSFTFMQSVLKVDLKNRYIFIEYHSGGIGEDMDELGYYLDQLLYLLKGNLPKGFILGRTDMRNLEGSSRSIDEINSYLVEKLSKYNLPIYYIDHFKNVITFS